MKFFTKEVKIGLAGIIALFFLIYGINYLKGVERYSLESEKRNNRMRKWLMN